jgi:hypothetical protein
MLLHLFVHKLEEFPLQKFAKTLIRKRSSRYGTMVVEEERSDLLAREEEGRQPASVRTSGDTAHCQAKSEAKRSITEPPAKKEGGLRAWFCGSRTKQSQDEAQDNAIIQDLLDGEGEGSSPRPGNTGQSTPSSLQSPRTFRTRSYPLSLSGGDQLAHTQDDKDRLKKMGVMTALAIGLHNFPEGMAAFVATLSATSLGLAVTFAVAIHNIPVRPLTILPSDLSDT